MKKKLCQKFSVLKKKSQEIATIAYNMKGCLRYSIFIFWISPNIPKYTYGQLPFEQHYRIKGAGEH